MDNETLIRVRFQGGRYEGILSCADASGTAIEAVHDGRVIAAAVLTPEDAKRNSWRMTVDLPGDIIGEGVQVIALRSSTTDRVLDRITLMAGAPLDEDIRVELALVRDELEMLKRAFRRHCSETGGR
jgi:energy-converting hydrogenase Eha subunit A